MSCPQYKNNKLKNVVTLSESQSGASRCQARLSNKHQIGLPFPICPQFLIQLDTTSPLGSFTCLQAQAPITLYNNYGIILLLCLKQQNSEPFEGLEGLTKSQLSGPSPIFSNLMSTLVPEFPYYSNLSVVIVLHYLIYLTLR